MDANGFSRGESGCRIALLDTGKDVRNTSQRGCLVASR
jgi:hypothetical protein